MRIWNIDILVVPGYHGKVTQVLLAVQLDVLKVHDHVQQLLVIFEVRFNDDIMVKADKIAKAVEI